MKMRFPFPVNKNLKKVWLLTLLDLMMLMLTFFIMLYSMSTPNIPAKSKSNFNINAQKISVLPHAVHLNYLEQILSQQIGQFKNYRIFQKQNVLHIQIPQSIFEDTSLRTVWQQDKAHIQALGELLNNVSNKIILRVGLSNTPFKENLLQGIAIANLLRQGGYTSNLRIIQYNDLKDAPFEIIIFPQTKDN